MGRYEEAFSASNFLLSKKDLPENARECAETNLTFSRIQGIKGEKIKRNRLLFAHIVPRHLITEIRHCKLNTHERKL